MQLKINKNIHFIIFVFILLNISNMDIQVKKLELIKWIAQISDSNIISKMDKIRRTYLTISKDNFNPMTIEEFYTSIDRAEKDIKSKRIFTQSEVEEESKNW